MERSRWFAVGQASRDDDRPGSRAAEQALVHPDAKLLVVFCSPSLDAEDIVGQIHQRSGGTPLIGCSTAGEIASGGPVGSGVVVAALGGPGFSVRTGVATVESGGDLRGAGALVANDVLEADGEATDGPADPHHVLLLLSDGMAGDQQEILRGVYAAVGAGIPLAGGCACDDMRMGHTFQLFGDNVHRHALTAAYIRSDAPIGIGVRHGWTPVGQPMLVTRASGRRIYGLDGRPALDVYLERLDLPDPNATSDLARVGIASPLGLAARTGEARIRFVAGGDLEERSLDCLAEIPTDSMVWIMSGDADSMLAATDEACAQAVASLGDRPPIGVIAFDCIGRKGVLGAEGMKEEAGRIAAATQNVPLAGFYAYGEIARTRGMQAFHNETLVVLSVA